MFAQLLKLSKDHFEYIFRYDLDMQTESKLMNKHGNLLELGLNFFFVSGRTLNPYNKPKLINENIYGTIFRFVSEQFIDTKPIMDFKWICV